MNNLRLMYSSNIMGCPSGYGVQSASLLPRLAELPEFGGEPGSIIGRQNIAQHAWYGLHGLSINIDGFKVYPGAADPYGNDVIGAHTKDFGANVVISLIDAWVLRDTADKIAPALFLPWTPCDHDPVPKAVLDALRGAYLTLSYSKWGRDMFTAADVENVYIPHGIETCIFRLLPMDERRAAFKRDMTGIDDAHLTVMVAANKGFPDRKAFQVQLPAWAEFAKDKPNARLYIHTEPTPMYQGIDFVAMTAALGLAGRVIMPDRYRYMLGYPPDWMAMMYNTADVYLGAAMSEGFGIPLVEAQGCGVPVVTTDFSAMPELVRWGHAVRPAHRFWTPMNSWQAWPDGPSITAALNDLYEQWWYADRGTGAVWQGKRAETSAAIHAEYDWDAIVRDQWRPLITRLADAAPPLDARFQIAPLPVVETPVANGKVQAMPEAVRG